MRVHCDPYVPWLQMVCQTISRERSNLSVIPELQHALKLITKLPEYQAKVQRTAKMMEATSALIARVEKQAALLREKSAEAART